MLFSPSFVHLTHLFILTPLFTLLSSAMHLSKRLIAIEEHTFLPSLHTTSNPFYTTTLSPDIERKLRDLSTTRLEAMSTAHITLQILSTIPGLASTNPSGCTAANNELASAIKRHPTRLAGLAALPMAHPDLAASELHRAVTELGLCGAMIDNHLLNGTYYDSPLYDPVFAMAEQLDVPIYIHPAPPTEPPMQNSFLGNYSTLTAIKLAGAAWGWHADVGLHILRLYAAGLFIRFPNLKIIIGHDGEVLPTMIDRVDDMRLRDDQTFSKVWDRNLWVSSAGFFHLRTFEMLLKVTRRDRVMFGVDYPLADCMDGWRFVEEVARSGVLSEEEMDMFAFGNAERLFKLDEKSGGDA